MNWDAVAAALDDVEAAYEKFAALSLDGLTAPELLAVLARRETLVWQQAATDHRVIARLAAECSPEELGATSLTEALARRLRISRRDARRRVAEAEDLGPRSAITGQPQEPLLANTADEQLHGRIGPEHVSVIRRFFAELPNHVDFGTREHAEATLAQIGAELGPEELRAAAERLAALLDQDGELSDKDRARKRALTVGRQGADGMTQISGLLDPEARAALDAVFAKLAAPGMCNPEAEAARLDGEPTAEDVNGDTRNRAQRNHDALKAACRGLLASGDLGQHNGLPVTVVVSTTLRELESAVGHAVTAGGSLLPMSDVIRMASHAYHYLTVFESHSEVPLYLGRTRRTASAGQRIVLYAKDRGCTFPGCTAPGYQCQVHHAERGWADGGRTDVDALTLACGPHNRLVKAGGWRTRKRKGRTEWIPPPDLDGGQVRTNHYHHPLRYLVDHEDEGVDDG
jgi:Domain of unknown function (DUF222)